MTKKGICFWTAAFLLGASPAAFAAGALEPLVRIGAWGGGSYTDDATGSFSHCAAGTTYRSGIYFVVGVTVDYAWSLGFANPSWELTVGETIPINLTFDNRSRFHVLGSVLRPDMVLVAMPDNSQLINSFRRAYTMTASAKGQVFGFNLDTTSQLLPALVDCVVASKNKTAGAAKRAPNVSSLQPGDASGTMSPELQFEAIELATNFILRSKLQNPKVLSRSDTPAQYASFGAAWKSDEAVGAVKIVAPDPNIKGIDVAAAIAAADAKECKGKFASGRVSELVDSEVVFRGFSSCEDTDGARAAQFFGDVPSFVELGGTSAAC